MRAGVEEDTAALGSVKVGELRAVRSLKARSLENYEVIFIRLISVPIKVTPLNFMSETL